MKTVQKVFLAIILILFFSFMPSTSEIEEDIIGIWVFEEYDEGHRVYKKEDRFDKTKRGIEFRKDGTLARRQNAGWCGTPPISYKNFSGTWEKVSDTKISMTYKYWGGEMEVDWLIVEVNNQKLKVETLDNRKKE